MINNIAKKNAIKKYADNPYHQHVTVNWKCVYSNEELGMLRKLILWYNAQHSLDIAVISNLFKWNAIFTKEIKKIVRLYVIQK